MGAFRLLAALGLAIVLASCASAPPAPINIGAADRFVWEDETPPARQTRRVARARPPVEQAVTTGAAARTDSSLEQSSSERDAAANAQDDRLSRKLNICRGC